MKKLYILLLLLVALAYLCYTRNQADNEPITAETAPTHESVSVEVEKPPQRKYLGRYSIYAYCPCVKCCGKTNGITASGTVATEGRTIAANLPFGTKLYIDGIGERIVEDRGGGIKGKTIDLFMSDHNSALQFGVRKLDVYEVME